MFRTPEFVPELVIFQAPGITYEPEMCEQVIVWNARTGAEQLSMRAHESVVGAVAFAPDGTP